MNRPGRALWPLVFLSACVGSERVEVRPPSLGPLPEPKTAAPPTSSETNPISGDDLETGELHLVDPPPIPVPVAVRRTIDAYPADTLEDVSLGTQPETVQQAVELVYRRAGGAYQWSDGQRVSTAAKGLLRLIRSADDHGIRADLLRAGRLSQLESALEWNSSLLAKSEPGEHAHQQLLRLREELLYRLDAQLTASSLSLARLMNVTRASGAELAEQFPEAAALEDWIVTMVPWHPQYARLTQALGRYRRYSAFKDVGYSGPLPLKAGQESNVRRATIMALRTRLAAEGFASGASPDSGSFDRTLADDLGAFQYSRGLPVDGQLDKDTLAALNVPHRDLLSSLRKALSSWRKSPTRREQSFVQVNLPDFSVEYYRDGERRVRQRAVIGYAFGSGGGRTPLFHSTVRQVTINPGWTPSDNILSKDLLPKERLDPGYLRSRGFRWFTRPGPAKRRGVYQLPGDKNALGRSTINFDNDKNIYLHGSPDPGQFKLAVRAMSHGCVRVQAIEDLAIAILEDDGVMNAGDFESALDSKRTRPIDLRQPLPIHFEYAEVVVEDDDQVRFMPNIYRR